MVSYDSNYEGVTRHCTECGKQMSSFQIGTDELKSSDDPTKGMCSDCAIPDERERFGSEVIERNLEACGYPSVSDEYEESGCDDFESDFQEKFGLHPDEVTAHQDQCCRHCGEHKDDCSCGCHDNGIYSGRYSDPPDEHEFQDDYDYDDYDSTGGRLYPDPDDDEVFF